MESKILTPDKYEIEKGVDLDYVIGECYKNIPVKIYRDNSLMTYGEVEVTQSQWQVAGKIGEIVRDVESGKREGGILSVLGAMGLGKGNIGWMATENVKESEIGIHRIDLLRFLREVGKDGKVPYLTQAKPNGFDTGLRAYPYNDFREMREELFVGGPTLIIFDEAVFATGFDALSYLGAWAKKHDKVIVYLGLNYNYQTVLFGDILKVIEMCNLGNFLVASQCRVTEDCLEPAWQTRRLEKTKGFWHPSLVSGEIVVAGSVHADEKKTVHYQACCKKHYQLFGEEQAEAINNGARVKRDEQGMYIFVK